MTWGISNADRDRTSPECRTWARSGCGSRCRGTTSRRRRASTPCSRITTTRSQKAAAVGREDRRDGLHGAVMGVRRGDREIAAARPRRLRGLHALRRTALGRPGGRLGGLERAEPLGLLEHRPRPGAIRRAAQGRLSGDQGGRPDRAPSCYGGVSYNDYRFLEGAYAAVPNLGDYYDVMATTRTRRPIRPRTSGTTRDGRLAKKSFVAYREVRDVMLANGDDKPIWFTEFGWSTNSLPGLGRQRGQPGRLLTRAMRCIEQDPYVQVAIWYIYRNHATRPTRTPGSTSSGSCGAISRRSPPTTPSRPTRPAIRGARTTIRSPRSPLRRRTSAHCRPAN